MKKTITNHELTELLGLELAKALMDGYVIKYTIMRNSMPYAELTKNGEVIVIQAYEEYRTFGENPKIQIKVGDNVIHEFYEVRYNMYSTDESFVDEVIQKRIERASRRSVVNAMQPAPQMLVNKVKSIRGFGVATKANLTYKRVNGSILVKLVDPRVKTKTAYL